MFPCTYFSLGFFVFSLFVEGLLFDKQSAEAGSSWTGLSSSVGHDEVDEVIAGFTLTAVTECLSSIESEPSAAADQGFMPPPDATFLQLKQNLSKHLILFSNVN
jgi:hypothetical protein